MTLGAAYVFIKIVLPLAALALIAYMAYRLANRDRHPTFSSSSPDLTEEHRFELEDVHDINDQPPRA